MGTWFCSGRQIDKRIIKHRGVKARDPADGLREAKVFQLTKQNQDYEYNPSIISYVSPK